MPDPATIESIVQTRAKELGLEAVIYRVVRSGEPVVTNAIGESMTGVPATPDMVFRNGAVAIAYVSTLLLLLAEDGIVGLDDPISAWIPDLPDADTVTPRMLITMTAGYPDYVPNPTFQSASYANPFRQWTPRELIEFGSSSGPRTFEPGTNWDYSHTNMVILGQVIETATKQNVGDLLRTRVFEPLGLRRTFCLDTAELPEPALHAFTSERKLFFETLVGTEFYEESTFWNPSWTLAPGMITVSDIADSTAIALDWANGSLLNAESHKAQITPLPFGFGSLVEGCRTCHPLDDIYDYAMGLVVSGGWLTQNPLFAGYGAVVAVLPPEELAIAVAVTFAPEGFAADGDYRHGSAAVTMLKAIAAEFTSTLPLQG